MLSRISSYLVDLLLSKSIIKKDEEEVYLYGIQLFILKCVHISLMILIGSLICSLFSSILFIIVYSVLRKFAGGFHAANNRNCFINSSIIMTAAMIMIRYYELLKLKHFSIICIMITVFLIIILAPVDCSTKPADNEEIRLFRRITIYAVIIFTMMALCFSMFHLNYYIVIQAAFLIETIMLLAGIKSSPRYNKKNKGVEQG